MHDAKLIVQVLYACHELLHDDVDICSFARMVSLSLLLDVLLKVHLHLFKNYKEFSVFILNPLGLEHIGTVHSSFGHLAELK